MPYLPDPENGAEPLDARPAGTAAAEFRALKTYIQDVLVASVTAANAQITVLTNALNDANATITAMQPAIAITGDIIYRFATTARPGWVIASGRTIGSAISGATERANGDTLALYTHVWNETQSIVADYPSIQNAAGIPTARGVSAEADFAAGKRMPLVDTMGRAIRGLNVLGTGVDVGRKLGTTQNHAMQKLLGTVGVFPQYGAIQPDLASGVFKSEGAGVGTPPNIGGSAGQRYIKLDTSLDVTLNVSTENRMDNAALLCMMKL